MRITELVWTWLQSKKYLWILVICTVTVTLGIAMGWGVATGNVPQVTFLTGAVGMVGVLVVCLHFSITILSLQRTLIYFTILTGFIGAAFFKIGLGPIHLFPYRILLPMLWMLFAINLIIDHGRVSILHIKVKLYLQFLGLWLLYAILSSVWTLSRVDAIREIMFIFMAVSIIFFIVYYFSDLKELKRFYTLWLLILLPLIGVGFWNHLTGNHLSVSGLIDAPERFRFSPTAVFYNQNDFATYLALSISFLIAFIRYSNNITKRLLGVLMLGSSIYLIVVTFSRANYLAVISGVTFWFFFLIRNKSKMKGIALTGIIVVLVFITFPNQIQDILGTINVELDSLIDVETKLKNSIGVRINLIRNAFFFIIDTFGFGVGSGNVVYYMANYQIYDTFGKDDMHNWWIEIFVNYGLLIFIGYVAFYLCLFVNLYKIRGKLKNKLEKMICEALLIGLVIFFFSSMGASSIMTHRPQWFFFGFVLAFLNYWRLKRMRETR